VMSDEHAKYLVSVKAIILHNGKVVLVRNDRDEWDLPGGKLEQGEGLDAALSRELDEELGVKVMTSQLLKASLHHFYPDILVLIHGCFVEGMESATISSEHSELGMFTFEDLPVAEIPPPYLQPIEVWLERSGA
jgi:ADP-ribose pyrophosphatase YjhB (NUDIX family)